VQGGNLCEQRVNFSKFNNRKIQEIGGSIDMYVMKKVFKLSDEEMAQLSKADLCTKRQILDCLNPEALGSGSTEDKKALLDFYTSSELIDPCSGNPIDKDAIFMELCGKGNINMAGLDEELEGVDYIIINRKTPCGLTKDICPKLNKIFDLFIGTSNSSTKPNCDLLKKLGESVKIPIAFSLDCDNTNISKNKDGKTPLGQTRIIQDSGILVYFSKDLCDLSCLEIASVFIHESIHAEIGRKVLDKLPPPLDNYPITASQFKSVWDQISLNDFDNLRNHHDIIAEFYIDEYAKAMWNATGKQGAWEDFRYWAYHGLNVEQAEQNGSTVITQEKYNTYLNSWNIVKNNINFNCND